jgi:hypothetical protein
MACEKRPEIILKKELYYCNMANIYFKNLKEKLQPN